MEQKNEIRLFIRQTLNEAANTTSETVDPIIPTEQDNTMANIVRDEETSTNTLNEKNQLDDRTQQGVDKIFAKVNDKLK